MTTRTFVSCLVGLVLFQLLAISSLDSKAFAAGPQVVNERALSLTIAAKDVDPAATVTWFDGKEQPLGETVTAPDALAVRGDDLKPSGLRFGKSSNPGPRHLRMGFVRAVPVGSVLVAGNCALSVLKPEAKYPGDLSDDAQWIAAERLTASSVTTEQGRASEMAIWVLPPGTQTRAVRFTHTPALTDKDYTGFVGGARIFSPRLANIAAQARITASVREDTASKIINGLDDGWGAWDNCIEDTKLKPQPAPGEPWFVLTWPAKAKISGLVLQRIIAKTIEVEAYTGPEDRHPREASEADWHAVATFDQLQNDYPIHIARRMLAFEQTVTTRALRIRMTEPQDTSSGKVHPHMTNRSMNGRRYSLSELLVLAPLNDAPANTALIPVPADDTTPAGSIAIPIELSQESDVTLVIEDSTGKRIRNLISQTRLPAGKSTIYWDAMDDIGRDPAAPRYGLYYIPSQPVAPGEYRVHGLVHKPVSLTYEFSVYSYGSPPWETADKSGGWLTNHTPPNCTQFVPGNRTPNGEPMVYIGSHVSEGGAGLAWVNLDGKKVGGRGWIGGTWTAAQHLTRDDGNDADANVYLYVGSTFDQELRLTALTKGEDKPILKWNFDKKDVTALGSIAARNSMIVCSLPKLNQLLFVNAKTNAVIGSVAMPEPRGLAFDAQGNLLVISGTQVVRFPVTNMQVIDPHAGKPVITTQLLEPRHLTFDKQGQIYVSDHGASHQVKVFTSGGQFVRAIGNPGAPAAGPYDRLHMNHPQGITIDANDHLWVAEGDSQPKRVSVWSLDGKLWKEMYGPAKYAGSGKLDPRDKSRFYFNGMEFKLDWDKGTFALKQVFHRLPTNQDDDDRFGGGPPENPHEIAGRQYWCNSYNSRPTGGNGLTTIWINRNGLAVPAATMGRANDWPRLREADMQSRWPREVDLQKLKGDNPHACLWSDRNEDGRIQPEEVTIWKVTGVGGVIVQDDLSFVISRLSEQGVRLRPVSFTKNGVPEYDLQKAEVLYESANRPGSSGGDQTLVDDDGRVISTLGIKPFHTLSVSGSYRGVPTWSYPNLWPGLHASHHAAVPSQPGQLIGVTRLLGDTFTPGQSQAGPLWAVNGNMGNMYVMTTDGLFVAELFHDIRRAPMWSMPAGQRGLDVTNVSLHDENFWPMITRTEDGKVYVSTRMALVRVDGLDSLRRIELPPIKVTEADLIKARDLQLARETARQKKDGAGVMKINTLPADVKVDADLSKWNGATWVSIDKRGTAANFNSTARPYTTDAAVAISGDRLIAVWRTNEPKLLENAGGVLNAPFKTGGALDLMIGCDPTAKPDRARPVQGDLRLIVTTAKGSSNKPVALLYRAVDPGAGTEKIRFASPVRTIYFDKVEDVSSQVKLAINEANYEISIPLQTLGLSVKPGLSIKGDIGVLRGNGVETLQRVYWNNKATAIVSDVPSEAELLPALWGTWQFP